MHCQLVARTSTISSIRKTSIGVVQVQHLLPVFARGQQQERWLNCGMFLRTDHGGRHAGVGIGSGLCSHYRQAKQANFESTATENLTRPLLHDYCLLAIAAPSLRSGRTPGLIHIEPTTEDFNREDTNDQQHPSNCVLLVRLSKSHAAQTSSRTQPPCYTSGRSRQFRTDEKAHIQATFSQTSFTKINKVAITQHPRDEEVKSSSNASVCLCGSDHHEQASITCDKPAPFGHSLYKGMSKSPRKSACTPERPSSPGPLPSG
ncbi:hypothetical protein AC578_5669 [Pseudocercospora eumusae]|uniref:Uncharacterized protein n=1 Tax=Pseudocercospora eumusae TaxID=321146 RepID=A0A139H3L1_9PEZI|nr:hypothetical protein AC578_5669 [Pseudocercospora eumusae]